MNGETMANTTEDYTARRGAKVKAIGSERGLALSREVLLYTGESEQEGVDGAGLGSGGDLGKGELSSLRGPESWRRRAVGRHGAQGRPGPTRWLDVESVEVADEM
ncbi:uncharacterized protein A4U43_C07F24160 [Asparagus officinalis]|uniref:Uncharacterized protein n=1 Tax=Asparagus officinalis TaxID=4686 RepID=A0A5P1EEU0_ASPOF|nr:uncharacterized protein A4U43_C07F24160 [Asparagus officinalis]